MHDDVNYSVKATNESLQKRVATQGSEFFGFVGRIAVSTSGLFSVGK
jgi:hypothetical protein